MADVKEEIIELLKKELKLKEVVLEIPPDPDLGDYAFPCFQLSKEMKKNPMHIALDLAKKLKKPAMVEEIKEAGPYLNFFVNKQKLAKTVIEKVMKEKESYGSKKKNGKKVMVEYVSPNTNKSLHLGHIRNGVLGAAVCNLLKFNGYDVVKACLNNDRGTGVAEAMLGYKKFFSGKEPTGKPDKFVGECYVAMKKAMKDNPALADEVKEMVLKWEQGDKEVVDLWKKMMKWVYLGYKDTYKRLGISFDKEYYESEIYKEGKDIVKKGIEKGIFEKDEGAIIAKLEEYGLPNKILIKSDGTSLYMTQDLYLAKLKFDEFKLDSSVYVVASEQDNHFRQLFKILELLKFPFADKCSHLSYGLVSLPSGRMKSREGKVVEADDLMESTVSLAKEEIKKRHKLSENEVDARAEIIGLGAIKFLMLKYDNSTSFVFNPEEAISFEGETGPYVQYVYARINSMFEKAGKIGNNADFSKLHAPEELKLVMLLSKFEFEASYKPHLIARYLLDLSQAFNEFYQKCPVLMAEDDVKKARLMLSKAVQQVIGNGLRLLGIDAPKAM